MRLALLLASLTLVVAACGSAGGTVSGTGAPAVAPAPEGPFVEFRGAPLVANVWASW